MRVIEILSASLTPVIAVIGVIIAVCQWRINQKRLQNELFGRRIELYQIIATYIANVVSRGKVGHTETDQFLRDTKHATFIFDNHIADDIDAICKNSYHL